MFFKWFKLLWPRRETKPPNEILIHHSFFRGWPRSPSIQLQTFPLSVKVSLAPVPTALPINVVEYTFLETDSIAGMQRATYLLTDANFHKNVPGFIWVFTL
jgi:hypothetical protein